MDARLLLVLIIALQVADIATTIIALKNNVEANPVMRFFFNKVGVVPALLLIKLAFVGFLVVFRHDIHIHAMYVVAALYAYIVFNNVKILQSTP